MKNLKETLAQFRKLDAKRTKKAWSYDGDRTISAVWYADKTVTVAKVTNPEWHEDNRSGSIEAAANAAFIAYAANNALPALEQAVAEIERHKQTIESMSGLLGLIRLELSTADGWEDGETFYKRAVENIREALSETTE